jgi:hypothetical protein
LFERVDARRDLDFLGELVRVLGHAIFAGSNAGKSIASSLGCALARAPP